VNTALLLVEAISIDIFIGFLLEFTDCLEFKRFVGLLLFRLDELEFLVSAL